MYNYGQNIHKSTHGWGSLDRCQNLQTELNPSQLGHGLFNF